MGACPSKDEVDTIHAQVFTAPSRRTIIVLNATDGHVELLCTADTA